MSFSTFGDLASTFQSRTYSARIKQDLTRLGLELTSGVKLDVSTAVTGDFGPIAGIEHSLKLMDARDQAVNAAKTRMTVSQTALENVQTQVQDLSSGVLSAVSSRNATLIGTTAVDARQKFASVISSMNVQVAGRSVFAGAATDGLALADAETIIADLMTAISAETTAGGVSNAINDWFDLPGGGFDTIAYLGAAVDQGPIRLGNGETVEAPVRADDTAIRDTLKALAKTLVIAEGALSSDVAEQAGLMEMSAQNLLEAVDGITMARAAVGAVEARIENAAAQNSAEKSTLELSRNELLAVDPYETATALQALYGQMESLYTVTARLSQLNFTDYMR